MATLVLQLPLRALRLRGRQARRGREEAKFWLHPRVFESSPVEACLESQLPASPVRL